MASRKLFTCLFILSLLASACSLGGAKATATPQPVTLKIAVLRILDALPLYVAEAQGYFAKHGIQVEFIPVSSAPERDQLLASGQADGSINEITSTMLADRDQTTLQVVRYARTATPDQPVFRLLASADSGITNLAGLQGVETGISQGTIIEYLFNRLIEAEGFDSAQFPSVNVPSIPDRMTMLQSGQLKAAILPEPSSSLAVKNGAVVVIDDSSHPEYGYSTYAFRKAVIDQHPEAIKAFLAAIEDATNDINANPNQWTSLLTDRQLIPQPLAGTYKVPPFVKAGVPTPEQFADALAWVKAKGFLDKDLNYSDVVNASFLP